MNRREAIFLWYELGMTERNFYEAGASSFFCHAVRTKIVSLDCDGDRNLQFFYDGVCGVIDV